MIGRHNYIALHKSEWDRLRRKSSPESIDHKREDYFKSLNEQSQNWMKLWPDTIQGHVNNLKKQKKIERSILKENVKNFALKKELHRAAETIKEAKELIFADSCYGRQLLSALIESKTLEERDLQLKFKKGLKENHSSNQLSSLSLQDSKQMELNEKTSKLKRDQISKDVAKCNAAMFEIKKEKNLKEKEEKILELEEVKLNNEFMKRTPEIEANMINEQKKALKEHEAEHRRITELRAIREKQDELERNIWQKYKERLRDRKKMVYHKIHYERYETPQYQKVFETIQNNEDDKNKKYYEFVQKGIERWLDKSNNRTKKEIENKTSLRDCKKLMDEDNKIQAELKNLKLRCEKNKCICYRQCILPIPKCSGVPEQRNLKNNDENKPLFVNKNLENLKSRHAEPIPWNALGAAHKQFFQHAIKTLQECRYKNAARKVVDEYKRINCLDSKSLPVSNYD